MSQQELDKKIVVIFKFIDGYFSKLTVEEIVEAFRMYVARKFTDIKVFRMIDCVSVSEVLNAYIDYRNEAIAPFVEKRKMLLNASVEKTDQEKEQIFKDFVKMVYEDVKENGFSADGWGLFCKLEDLNEIVISIEEKQQMYKRELSLYVPNERNRIKLQNPINYKSAIIEFEKTYMNGNKSNYIKNRCRSILVSKFINEKTNSLEEFMEILNKKP